MLIICDSKRKQELLTKYPNLTIPFFVIEKLSQKDIFHYRKIKKGLKYGQKNGLTRFIVIPSKGDELNITYKEDYAWRTLDKLTLTNLYLFNTNNLEISYDINLVSETTEKLIKANHIFREQELMLFVDKAGILNDKTKSVIDFEIEKIIEISLKENFVQRLKTFQAIYGSQSIQHRIFQSTEQNIRELLQQIENNVYIHTIRNKKFVGKIEDEEFIRFKFTVEDGWVVIKFNKKTNSAESITSLANKKWNSLYYSVSATADNVQFYTNKETWTAPKFNKKNYIWMAIGATIFATLTWATFRWIFGGGVAYNAFATISFSFVTPWPYLILMNYLLTQLNFIFAIILFNRIYKRQERTKDDIKRSTIRVLIGGQISFFVGVITGFYWMGMLVFVWYMSRGKSGAKATSFVGMMANVTLIFGIINFIAGLIFVSIGTSYVQTLSWDQAGLPSTMYILIAFAWVGLFVETFIRTSTRLVLVAPRLNRYFFKFYLLYLVYIKKDNFFKKSDAIAVRQFQLAESSKGMWKDKKNRETLYRMIFVVFFTNTLNLFEYSYMMSLTLYTDGIYQPWMWEVFRINSLRQTIFYANQINPFPGNMGTTEFSINQAMQATYWNNITPESMGHTYEEHVAWVNYESLELAFVSRFFNFYLPLTIAGVLTTGALSHKNYKLSQERKGK